MNKTATLQKLSALQTLIEQEFAEFRDEITTSDGTETFNRAEEIVIKTHLTDEILNGFENIKEYANDETTVDGVIHTLHALITDRYCENVLDFIYNGFIEDCEGIVDMAAVADFLVINFEEAL